MVERLDRNSLAAVLCPLGSARRALGRVQVDSAVAPHGGRMSANASGVSWLPVPRTQIGHEQSAATDCFTVAYLGRNMDSIGLLNSAAMAKANERLGS